MESFSKQKNRIKVKWQAPYLITLEHLQFWI